MQAPRRVVICLAAALAAAGVAVGQEPIRFVHEPALSPDGRLLAFTWAGDVWSVPTTGGRASRLTNHPADDGNPTFSPDGTLLAFTSNRAGNYDVYLMASGGSAPRRLTFHAGSDGASGFTPDGKQVLFASRRYGPVAGPNRMEFLVPIEGGTPRRLQPVEGSVGQFSPDGTKLVFVRGGVGASRRGYRGPAAEEIWLHDLTNNTYRPLASHPAVDTWPQWAADGRSIYFASDRDGVRNLYRLQLEDGTLTPVTRHAEPIGAPTISR
ncbi:MAG: PD40 domain-containing protein, partial [Armatimonadetes bacterium]|nr:PD40 domain-containing protein [Armatimonadota bacterium]